jgi:adenylate kinase
MLAAKTGWRVITAGDQFRAIAAEDTPVGRKVKVENDAGMLQPHWLAMYLFLKSLFTVGENENAIFDGFNRKVMEAELVTNALSWLGRPCTVLNIQDSDAEVEKRLALRKEAQGRADDNVVDERLNEYHQYTEPAIDIFRKSGELIEINGEQSPDQVAVDIDAALDIK